MNKLLFALSLAKKSGKRVMGFDAVKTAVIHGTAHIVLLAEDLSEKTVKRVNYFCEDLTEVHNTGLTQFEISQVAGRLTGVLAVTDENLAVLARNALQ